MLEASVFGDELRSRKMVTSNRRYITALITVGLYGSPPGVMTTAKMTMPSKT